MDKEEQKRQIDEWVRLNNVTRLRPRKARGDKETLKAKREYMRALRSEKTKKEKRKRQKKRRNERRKLERAKSAILSKNSPHLLNS